MRRGRIPHGIFAADVQVFRFFPNGIVLDVLVKPAPGPEHGALIASWLRPDTRNSAVHKTRYDRVGHRISLLTEDHFRGGVVEVSGSCSRDELILDLQARDRTQRQVRFRRIWPGDSGHDAQTS